MIDQPFQPRLPDGMIRCYMVRDEVVGFGHQLIKALMPSPPGTEPEQPDPRIMYASSEPAFQALRRKMESDWDAGDDASARDRSCVASGYLGCGLSLWTKD